MTLGAESGLYQDKQCVVLKPQAKRDMSVSYGPEAYVPCNEATRP